MIDQNDSIIVLCTLDATRPHRAEQPGFAQPVLKTQLVYWLPLPLDDH
jgi:hypothetical protein